ncbi:MAG: right-handed parallel beta-helix repeat-containing protein [Bacteroidales bacterium]
MKYFLIIFLVIPVISFAQNVVHINNSEELESINFESNKTYLLKSGFVYEVSKPIRFSNLQNVTLTSSENENLPEIRYTGDEDSDLVYIRASRNIRIENLKLTGSFNNSIVHISGHYSTDAPPTNHTTIRNCEISKAFNGIRSLPYSTKCDTITIIDCNIHHLTDDGVFIADCDFVKVQGCHIWHVNLNWNKGRVNSGDCIHLTGNCSNWIIKNNVLDRRLTSNKFCFIYGNKGYLPVQGEIVGNTFYPPKDTIGGVGSAIYISESDYVKIDSNRFLSDGYQWGGKPGAIAHLEARQIDFSNNYINNLTRCYFTNRVKKANVENNTMQDCFGKFFYYFGELNALNNTFYNLKGWAYAAEGAGGVLIDINTIYESD